MLTPAGARSGPGRRRRRSPFAAWLLLFAAGAAPAPAFTEELPVALTSVQIPCARLAVKVDGRLAQPRCEGDTAILTVAAGEHTVTVMADGFAASTFLLRIEAAPGQMPRFRLPRLTRLPVLDLRVTPAGAVVSVDNSAVEMPAGAAVLSLTPGSHTVTAEAKGFATVTRSVTLGDYGTTTALRISLDRLAPPPDALPVPAEPVARSAAKRRLVAPAPPVMAEGAGAGGSTRAPGKAVTEAVGGAPDRRAVSGESVGEAAKTLDEGHAAYTIEGLFLCSERSYRLMVEGPVPPRQVEARIDGQRVGRARLVTSGVPTEYAVELELPYPLMNRYSVKYTTVGTMVELSLEIDGKVVTDGARVVLHACDGGR